VYLIFRLSKFFDGILFPDALSFNLPPALQVTKRVLTATLCIVIGCVLLVSFGNHESQTLTVADMLSFYARLAYPDSQCLNLTLTDL
jgi:hypothetical protein